MPSEFQLSVNDRVYLTEIRATDKGAFVEHLDDPSIYDTTLRIPRPYTEADAEHFIEIAANATAKHGHPVNFAIRDASDKLIGGLGFDDLRHGHRAELGYWLAKPFWGQGIMTLVVQSACVFAVDQWKLVRIAAQVFASNQASARVLEKSGFAYEGLLRKHHVKDGRFIDARLYGRVTESH